MIVRLPSDELEGEICFDMIERGAYHGGSVSGWMETPDPPKRRIGFRMPEPAPAPPESPEWLLL